MRIEILLLVLSLISGTRSLRNGQRVESDHYSYIVSIWVYELWTLDYRCSGVILSKSHILTAGHCVHNIAAHDIIVTRTNAFESIFLETPVRFVDNVIHHPDFQRKFHPDKPTTEYWMHDIAVMKLMCDFTLSSSFVVVALDRRDRYQSSNKNCFIAGWNPVMTNTSLYLILSWAEAMTFGNGVSPTNSFLLPHEVYAFFTKSRALIDDMDSGNALICGGKAVGIIIGGRDRTRSVVSVLTIPPYKKFIDAAMMMGYEESID